MKKNKIVYHTDALCGWCYGFAEEFRKVRAKFSDTFDFEVISGGLFVGNRVGYINDVAPYIQQGAYLQVEQRTGKKFGVGFLKSGVAENAMYLDSLYPAIAMAIVKDKQPAKAIEFIDVLLHAFYEDGMSCDNASGYGEYASKLELAIEDFSKLMEQPSYRQKALDEFAFNNRQQIGGFPSLRLHTNSQVFNLVSGYTTFEQIEQRLAKFEEMTMNSSL